MLTWKESYGKGRNIGNINFSLIHIVETVFLSCIKVKVKVAGKTDGVIC